MIIGISGLAGSGKDTCADFLVRDYRCVKVSLADPLKRMCQDAFGFSYEQLWGPSMMRNAPDERYPREHGPPSRHDDWDGPHDTEQCACCSAWYEPYEPHSGGTPQCYLTPRFALQELGTRWGRGCYENVWIEYAVRVHRELQAGTGHYYYYAQQDGVRPRPSFGTRACKDVVIPDVRFKNEVDGLRAYGAKLIRVVRPSAGLGGAAGQHTSETEQAEIPDSAFDVVLQNDGTIADLEEKVRGWPK